MATKTPARARKSTASKTPKRPPARTDSTRPYALIKRKAWESKEQILTAGSAIQALSYQRTSGVTRGSETSVEDQQVENSEHIAARSWVWADTYTDNNKSASRHGKKVRTDMLRLKADILAGAGDVLVMCEVTRQTRQLREFAELVDICRAEGLRWWYVGGSLFDLEDPDDQVLLGLQAMLGQREAEIAAKRNRRAQKGSARRGRPHGPVRYGYIRLYDPETREIAEESPDEKPRRYHGPDGSWVGSHADVVRWIFRRYIGGTGKGEIRTDLHRLGVPSPSGAEWWSVASIGNVLTNRAYIGVRMHNGEVSCDEAFWDGLISPETFAAAEAMRAQKIRRYCTTRPDGKPKDKAVSLLGGTRCGECNVGRMVADSGANGGKDRARRYRYRCSNGCVSVGREILDAYVLKVITEELSEERWRKLYEPEEHRPDVAAIYAEAETVRAKLAEWESEAEAGEIGPREYKRFTAPLRAKLAALEEQGRQAAAPAILEPLLSAEDAATAFLRLDVDRQRQIIRTCLDVSVSKATKRGRGVIDPDRVSVEWLTAEDMTLAA